MSPPETTVFLSPMDQFMPRVYMRLFLLFETPEPLRAVENLKAGLKRLTQRLPWLKGRVFVTDFAGPHRGRVGLRWSEADSDVPFNESNASVDGLTYQKLVKEDGAPLHYFENEWCPPTGIFGPVDEEGSPVLGVNYTIIDGGLVVGFSYQHSVFDGTGMDQLICFWAECTRAETVNEKGAPDGEEPLLRESIVRLAAHSGQHTNGSAPSSATFHELLARCSVFTASDDALILPPGFVPDPSMPLPIPAGIKLFTFDVSKLNAVKSVVQAHDPKLEGVTTNSILSATVWSCITRVRAARNRWASTKRSKLTIPINIRRRVDPDGHSLTKRPYLGNATIENSFAMNFSDVANAAIECPATPGKATVDLSQLCEIIQKATKAPKKITPGHLGGILQLHDAAPSMADLLQWFSPFTPSDLVVTSWANMDLYDADFGEAVGKPQFLRMANVGGDGFIVVLPRKRATSDQVIEIILGLHPEDIETLEKDPIWTSYLKA